MAVKGRRPYTSERRAQSARETRRAVLAAAHALFVEQGYAATTVDQVAARAGVSKPTVFSSVGSKATLLKQVRDVAIAGDDEPVAVMERARHVLETDDAAEVLRRYAATVTAINSRYAAVEEVLHAAAGADAELRALWVTSEQQRRVGATAVIDALARKGTLRRSHAESVDLLWVLTAPDHLRRLVGDRGWTAEQFERWLGDTFVEQLLLP